MEHKLKLNDFIQSDIYRVFYFSVSFLLIREKISKKINSMIHRISCSSYESNAKVRYLVNQLNK